MRYVILRDDDTNALTPPSCLETLYRPFLDRGFPVNLAVIPEVDVNTRMANGMPEGYLFALNGIPPDKMAIGSNAALVKYLKANPGFRVLQHGCHHDYLEFDSLSRDEAGMKMDRGAKTLMGAGFPKPETFVAPYDKLSRGSLTEAASRFRVLSTGWFEFRRLPMTWWPKFAVKKLRKADHWRVGQMSLLSHPGCILSCQRPHGEILDAIIRHVESHELTVLVTHWWEYFQEGQRNEPLIGALHETCAWLGRQRDVKTIAFDELGRGEARVTP
jgi:predicted deacetylase